MGRSLQKIPWQAWVLLTWATVVAVLFLWPRRPTTIQDRAKDFCSEVGDAAFLGMQNDVDPRWIDVDDDEDGFVVDRRTGFRRSMSGILDLGKYCETKVTHLDDGLLLEQLCDVVFVVSPDWKIRAIMDEATWQARGREILGEIREELRRASGPSASPSPDER